MLNLLNVTAVKALSVSVKILTTLESRNSLTVPCNFVKFCVFVDK